MANSREAVSESDVAVLSGARAFNKDVAPSFLDHVCMTAGYAPPPGSPVGEGQGAGFAWCELHCGAAVNAALLAASNPLGDFHGIDAREMLIAQGRRLAADGGIRNLTLHQAGLEAALDLSLPPLDYIIVSGIYSWVPMRERGLVLAFVRKFLKPGGVVYVSYNARPGWNKLDAFRRLYREVSRGIDATPHQRLAVARDAYARLEQAKAPAILASGIRSQSLAELDRLPPEVLAADYANDFAEPLYVTEVISDFAAVDCRLSGSVDMAEQLPVLMAHEPFKSVLEGLPAQSARELGKDMLRDTRFRRDVFVRGGQRLSADNRDMLMNGLAFALEQPAEQIRFDVRMPFGEMRFDSAQARAIAGLLEKAPRTLGELVNEGQKAAGDPQAVLGAIHALLVSGQIRPVYRGNRQAADAARRLRDAVMARAATSDAIGFLPAPFGTAFFVPVADQLFAREPADAGAEALAAAAIARLGGSLSEPQREAVTRRARAFPHARRYYASVGIDLIPMRMQS